MNRIQSVATWVAIVSLILSAVLAGLYLYRVVQTPSDSELLIRQDGYSVTDAPAHPGDFGPKEAIIGPAAEAPSFA
jgi:hypothetical protein|nr:MAG TPA: hypothetical protein [Caudoviricetes sp.]